MWVTLEVMFTPKLSRSSAAAWFTDLRTIAFLNFVVSVSGLVAPIWRATQSMAAMESTRPQSKFWIIATMVLALLMTVVMPLFCFALFRNDGVLYFPRSIRPLAMTGVFSFVACVETTLPEVIRSLSLYWVQAHASGLSGVRSVSATAEALLGEFSNAVFILLLVAFYRQADDESLTDAEISRLLEITSKVALVAMGLWLGFNVIRLLLSPLGYSQLRDYAQRVGKPTPKFGRMVAEIIPALTSSLGFLMAPYIVYKSQIQKRMFSRTQ
jgi:hypothetical protein